jgi:hypothetical protein
MAKFIRRIGKKKHRYQAEAFVEKLELNINFPCQISVLWQRGKIKIY